MSQSLYFLPTLMHMDQNKKYKGSY